MFKRLWEKYGKSKLVQQTGWAMGAKIFAAGSFYLIYLLLVRSMTVERFGQWTLFWSYFIIFQRVSDFGMTLATKYFFAQNQQASDLKLILKSGLRLRLLLSLLFSFGIILFLICFPRTESHLFQESLYLISVLALFFYVFAEFQKAAFEGLHRLNSTFQITAIHAIISFFAIYFLFNYQASFENVILGYAIAYCIASVYGFVSLLKQSQISIQSILARVKNPFNSKIFKYSLTTFLLSICTSLAMEVDALMLDYLSTDYELGIYGAAKQLLRYFPHISMAISMGTLPAFAMITAENKKALQHKFRYVFGLNLGVFVAIALGLLTLGSTVLPWALGERFSPSVYPLYTLLPYIIFLAVGVLTNNLINYWGMARILIVNQIVAFCLNIVLNYFLIPKYGAVGAGISTSISMLPYMIVNLYWVKKKLF